MQKPTFVQEMFRQDKTRKTLKDTSDVVNTSQNAISLVFEKIAFFGILLTIFLTAIPYGTAQSWFKLWFVSLACIFGACRIISDVFNKSTLFTDFGLLLPPIGILLLGILQVISFTNIFEATSIGYTTEYVGTTLSLAPTETENFILIFLGLFIVAEVLLRYTNTSSRLVNLICLVIVVGIGSTLFGFMRNAVLDDASGFLASYLGPKVQFAQIVNRNHFALLIEMTLGLLLGLLIAGKPQSALKPLFWVLTAMSYFAIITVNSRGAIITTVGLSIFVTVSYLLISKTDSGFDLRKSSKAAAIIRSMKTALIASFLSSLLLALQSL
jgi:hypothetical protein